MLIYATREADSCSLHQGQGLKIYASYISNYAKAMDTLRECKQNKKFAELLQVSFVFGVSNVVCALGKGCVRKLRANALADRFHDPFMPRRATTGP